jgi:hypothetical protein
MLDPDIRSGNYTIDTQRGSVYLIGSARSQAELERATRIARYIPGVKRVITYVELRQVRLSHSSQHLRSSPRGRAPARNRHKDPERAFSSTHSLPTPEFTDSANNK